MKPPQKEGHQDSVVPNIVQGERDKRDIPAGFTLGPNGHFRCNVCQVLCNSQVSATEHVRGQKHLKTIASNQNSVVPNGVQGGDPDVPAGTLEKNGRFLCNVCKVFCSSRVNTTQHALGKKHLKALAREKGSGVPNSLTEAGQGDRLVITGKKHLKAVASNKAIARDHGSVSGVVKSGNGEMTTEQGDRDGIPVGFTREANASLRCVVCQVCCSSVKVFKDHVLGKRHRLQSSLLALKSNKDELIKLPKDIGLTCQNVTQTENGDLDCEVALKGHTMLTVTVTNNNDKDALTVQCNLLKDIKADIRQHKSLLKPGESGDVDIKIPGNHLGVYSTALAFKFMWQKQQQDLQQHLNVVRLLRVRCTNDIVTQLQPTTKYKRPRRPQFEPRAEIVDGFPPPKMSAGQLGHEVQLAQYPVPQYLNRLHSKHLEDSDDVDPELQEQFRKVKSVLTSELSPTNHCERFSLLLHCEEIQMHRDIRNYDMRGVTMTRCRENRRLLTLKVPGLAEKRPSVLKGDWLFVRSCDAKGKADGTKEFKGYVHNTCLNEVWLGFNESFLHNFVENSKFNVRFSVNRYPARMHHRALELAGNRMNSTFFPTTATAAIWEEPKHVNNELTVQNARQHFKDTRLLGNVQQVEAVCNIVSGRSRPTPYLVFGPPGTGKTVTIVEAMKQVLRVVPSAHIMACAPSNSAADLLAERLLLHVPAAQLFRLNAGSRSIITVPECIKACCNIDRHTRAMFYPSKKDLMKYKVIITTLVTAGRIVSAKFPAGHFTHVFIDEAGHAIEPEALVAIAGITDCSLGGQVVLAGDPEQLGPVIRSPIAKKYGLEMSLIERYMKKCDVYKRHKGTYDQRLVTKLVCNYRSHPSILKLPNECFYDNELKPCADKILRESLCSWEGLPKTGFPLVFHGVVAQETREESSPSFFNPSEVSVVIDYVTKLLDTRMVKIKETDIGIISPYRKQVQKLQKVLKNRRYGNVKTGSVEDFQGQERRVIIISTVRSNPEFLTLDTEYKLGFLNNPKRFNVAITRAKALLIVVGNPNILSKDKYWNMLLQECCSHGAYTGVELVDDDSAADDFLQRFTDMQLDDIDKCTAGGLGEQLDISAVTCHEDPEWRHEI